MSTNIIYGFQINEGPTRAQPAPSVITPAMLRYLLALHMLHAVGPAGETPTMAHKTFLVSMEAVHNAFLVKVGSQPIKIHSINGTSSSMTMLAVSKLISVVSTERSAGEY